MEKKKKYDLCRFSDETLREAVIAFGELFKGREIEGSYRSLSVDVDGATWRHDTIEEFLADYRRTNGGAHFEYQIKEINRDRSDGSYQYHTIYVRYLLLWDGWSWTEVTVTSTNRKNIESIFGIFDRKIDVSKLPEPDSNAEDKIFIGHGHGTAWRDLKDHLHDQHGYLIEAYETGARAGHAIRDILHEMASNSSFALLVMTGDDIGPDEQRRARQNVVHEIGLFQGRLGFERAIVLLENGVEEFSAIITLT